MGWRRKAKVNCFEENTEVMMMMNDVVSEICLYGARTL